MVYFALKELTNVLLKARAPIRDKNIQVSQTRLLTESTMVTKFLPGETEDNESINRQFGGWSPGNRVTGNTRGLRRPIADYPRIQGQ